MSLQIEKAKSQQIAEILEKEILYGYLLPGARIQSVRALSLRFEVSIKVIQNAFEILEQKQMIERRHGSGTFVKRIERQERGKVAFLFLASRNIEESYHFQVFRSVCREMQKYGFSVDLVTDSRLPELKNNYVGIICSSTVGHETIADIVSSGLPCATYGNVTNIEGLCEVNPDFFNGSVMAVNYLVSCDFKKIIFIKFSEEANQRSSICLKGYIKGLKNNHISFNDKLVWNYSEVSSRLDGMQQELKSGKYAFYVPNDSTAYDISNQLLGHGIKVPEEVGVMGFYNRSHAKFAKPALTTIGFSHEELGIEVAGKLYHNMLDGKVESSNIPVEIIKRESVCNEKKIAALSD